VAAAAGKTPRRNPHAWTICQLPARQALARVFGTTGPPPNDLVPAINGPRVRANETTTALPEPLIGIAHLLAIANAQEG